MAEETDDRAQYELVFFGLILVAVTAVFKIAWDSDWASQDALFPLLTIALIVGLTVVRIATILYRCRSLDSPGATPDWSDIRSMGIILFWICLFPPLFVLIGFVPSIAAYTFGFIYTRTYDVRMAVKGSLFAIVLTYVFFVEILSIQPP